MFSGDTAGLWGIVVFMVHVLGALSVISAIFNSRTSQGAIAWSLSLLMVPEVSLPLYWVFGRTKFYGYVDARRAESAKLRHIAESITTLRRGGHETELEGDFARFEVLERFADVPYTTHNEVELHIDGEKAFGAIREAIGQAENYVLAQFFIVRDDDMGRQFKADLIACAERGVRVYFLFDEIGSYGLSRRYLRELRNAGVVVSGFKTTRGFTNKFQLNFRNHRKLVVGDGKRAIVGGLNIGDEYLGDHPRFGPWRDTNAGIRGPAVQAVQLSFMEDWYWATREVPDLNWEMQTVEDSAQDVLVLPTGPADILESCALTFAHCINAATRRCWIASPYFVPGPEVMTALQLAAIRGVDVRVMLPEKADHWLVWLSSFYFGRESRNAGVKTYRYTPGFLHQKVMLIDDELAAVGTANLDNRSFRLNFEITVFAADRDFAAEVEEMMLRDFEDCRLVERGELGRRPWYFRVAVLAARLLAPVL